MTITETPKIFEARKLVIATKHKKENAITPLVTAKLGIVCFTPDNFDTDLLGTFTGEKERADDPLETARKKCHIAMTMTNCDMAIASAELVTVYAPVMGQLDHAVVCLITVANKRQGELPFRVVLAPQQGHAQYFGVKAD
jgi:hypothetical protein